MKSHSICRVWYAFLSEIKTNLFHMSRAVFSTNDHAGKKNPLQRRQLSNDLLIDFFQLVASQLIRGGKTLR